MLCESARRRTDTIEIIIDITETFIDISKNMRIERCIQNVSQ